MRYFMTFSYDGTNFNGYQKQPRERTIQSELEKVLKQINDDKKVDVHASGRTDAGVHALNQKAHFDLDIKITPGATYKISLQYRVKDFKLKERKLREEVKFFRYQGRVSPLPPHARRW